MFSSVSTKIGSPCNLTPSSLKSNNVCATASVTGALRRGYPQFFSVPWSRYWWNMRKITFLPQKNLGMGYPCPYPQNNPPVISHTHIVYSLWHFYRAPVTSKGCYQVRVLMLKAKIRPKMKSPATTKVSREVMFDIPPRHFGKRWGDEIFTVALLYAVLVICVKWSI